MKEPLEEGMRGCPKPALVEVREGDNMPSRGADNSSRPGMSHSSPTDHGQRSPRLTRPSRRYRLTSERYDDAIAGRRNGVGSSSRERGVEEGAAWEDDGEEMKRAGR
jgi:hypothetical protein